MESKLNTLAIKTYCSAFTDRVANDFFARHEKINGEQILKLSPVQQVNLFIIKNLFENWQQEASRLRSPYFNYSHPKVQEAQKVYMNTLSRHISIKEADLKPLLHKAVHDALVLLFVPGEYIYTALKSSSGQPEEVAEILKYARFNQAYAKEAKSVLNRQDVTNTAWLITLEEAIKEKEQKGDLQPESPTLYLQQFAEVLPVHSAEIVQDEELGRAGDADDDMDFFSSITSSLQEEREPDSIQQSQSAPAPDENLPSVSEAAHRHAQLRREEPELRTKAPEIQISRPVPEPESRQVKILNDTFEKERRSLNEKLTAPAEKQNLSALHARKKNGSLRSAINLNQRFMFTNELFNGDSQAFNQALDQLDSFDSYKAAQGYCMQQYASRYKWDLDDEASQEFLDLLQSRYS